MSTISNRHTVQAFDSAKSTALMDQRLAKITYKSRKGTPAKYPSVCVSIPGIVEPSEDQMKRLMPHLCSLLENAQDGIIRSLYESNDGVLGSVSDDEISIDACISFMETEATGRRLTKELIESWFVNGEAQENCAVLIATKLGYGEELTAEQAKTVNQHVNAFKGVFSSLAGGKTLMNQKQISGLRTVLDTMEPDDVSKKLSARLTSMETPKSVAELLEL